MRDQVGTTSNRVAPAFARPATVSRPRNPRIVDLRHMSPLDLDPLLSDETIEWDLALDWDFTKSADLVRKLSAAGRLAGRALVDGREVAAYGYAGLGGYKGVISDVYVRPAWRSGNFEEVLLQTLFDALVGTPGVRRIESQLMLVEAASVKSLQSKRTVDLFERLLMMLDSNSTLPERAASTAPRFRLETWRDHHRAAAAKVIASAYCGQIDAQINDRCRTTAAADRFLQDLIQFTGCATFCAPSSYVAIEAASGSVVGFSIASFIAADVAHIAELCVMPQARRGGLGYELLRRSIGSLRDAGAKRISLAVTAANEDALRLYRQCGFREVRRFHALVWERSWVGSQSRG